MSRKGAETPRGHIRRFLGVFASLREIPVDRAQDWIRLGEKASETIGPTPLISRRPHRIPTSDLRPSDAEPSSARYDHRG